MEGYMTDTKGRLVPEGNVREIDKLRDELVKKLAADAKEAAAADAERERRAMASVASFVSLAAQDYGVDMGGRKGNVTLLSYDGSLKVIRAMDDSIGFTEGLNVAREMIDRCIKAWSEGANAKIIALVNSAFTADRQGNLSAAKVLGLAQVKIDDPDWQKAMDALRDSVRVVETKAYLRVYERGADGKYNQIGGR